jgi:RHS repeat-associated protein
MTRHARRVAGLYRDASGVPTRRRFTLGHQVGSESQYFATDHLGSVRVVTNNSEDVIGSYAFDPWGRRTVLSGSPIPIGFTGHTQHASGLVLSLFRAYDPELARWTSPDPAGYVDGVNLLAYVRNAPTQLYDPLGLSAAGRWVECGPCMIRIDNDPHKGRHAQWECRGGSTGCIKPDGSGCEGSGPPPNRVRRCLEKERFFKVEPVSICGQNCQQVIMIVGIIVVSAALACLLGPRMPVPQPSIY